MSDLQYILDSRVGCHATDFPMGEVQEIIFGVQRGDLHTLDGDLIQALADLADGDNLVRVEDCAVRRFGGLFVITHDDHFTEQHEALQACLEALQGPHDSAGNIRPGWHLTPRAAAESRAEDEADRADAMNDERALRHHPAA